MDGIISMANGSASSLYGNIAYAIRDLIISKFPPNYFKYIGVSSELATRNMHRLFGGPNSSTEIQKRSKPYLTIQPTFSVSDMDGALQNIPLTSNFDDLQYRVDKGYLFEAIRDTKNEYSLKFKMNRDRIECDITVMTPNLHSQLDIYRTMKNQMIWDRSFAYRAALESVIPKELIEIISKYCNMDIVKHEEYIPILLQRLNACSAYAITYKLRNASATDEWFLYYTHNLIITFTDLNIETGRRKNMVEDEFPITFRVIAEFNLPGVYFIDGNTDKLRGLDITLVSKDYQPEKDTYIPIYTINNLYSRFPYESDGMQLYGATIFKTETSGKLEERIDIKCVLDNDHIRAIRMHKSWKMNPDTLLKIYLLKDGIMQKYRDNFYIDWNTLELVVKNPDKELTYRLVLYFNYETVNEILNNTSYENNYTVDKLHENKAPTKGIEDESVYIVDSNSNWIQESETMHTLEGATEEEKNDPNSIILEHDPTYCKGCAHTKIDPEVVMFNNKVIIKSHIENFSQVSKTMFLDDHIPPEAIGKEDTVILEEDPTYCKHEDHEKIDPELILYNNRVMIKSHIDNFSRVAPNTYLDGHVPSDAEDNPKTVILEEDPTYCGNDNNDFSQGIPIEMASIAGLDDVPYSDIHNDPILEESKLKKKFSSSIE